MMIHTDNNNNTMGLPVASDSDESDQDTRKRKRFQSGKRRIRAKQSNDEEDALPFIPLSTEVPEEEVPEEEVPVEEVSVDIEEVPVDIEEVPVEEVPEVAEELKIEEEDAEVIDSLLGEQAEESDDEEGDIVCNTQTMLSEWNSDGVWTTNDNTKFVGSDVNNYIERMVRYLREDNLYAEKFLQDLGESIEYPDDSILKEFVTIDGLDYKFANWYNIPVLKGRSGILRLDKIACPKSPNVLSQVLTCNFAKGLTGHVVELYNHVAEEVDVEPYISNMMAANPFECKRIEINESSTMKSLRVMVQCMLSKQCKFVIESGKFVIDLPLMWSHQTFAMMCAGVKETNHQAYVLKIGKWNKSDMEVDVSDVIPEDASMITLCCTVIDGEKKKGTWKSSTTMGKIVPLIEFNISSR